MCPIPLVSSSIWSIFSSSLAISSVMSKYILAAKNLVFLYSSSRSTLSGLDSCVMSTASIFFVSNYYGGPVFVFEGGANSM